MGSFRLNVEAGALSAMDRQLGRTPTTIAEWRSAALPALRVLHGANGDDDGVSCSGVLTRSQLDDLRRVVGGEGLITGTTQLQTYECDGLTNFRVLPDAVVLPRNAEQVQAVVRLCARDGVPFVSRGAGTGLSGGALPVTGGIVISLARMN